MEVSMFSGRAVNSCCGLGLQLFLAAATFSSRAAAPSSDLALLTTAPTAMENSLWVETPPVRQFETTTSVECANITGPGEITMIHFALPEADISSTHTLGRELLLRIYWDDETEPSVDCPMVDFFCDPA